MTLKLEVGKRYRTREGFTVQIARASNNTATLHLADDAEPLGLWSVGSGWRENGRYNCSNPEHRQNGCPLDLISEIFDEPKKESPMVKMVVRGEKPKEQVIEWWLEQQSDGVCLHAKSSADNYSQAILSVTPDGVYRYVQRTTGLACSDNSARIKVID